MEGLEARAIQAGDPQVLAPTLATLALIDASSGSLDRGKRLISDLGHAARSELAPLAEICRIAVASDAHDDAVALVESITVRPPRTLHALASARARLAESERDYAEALNMYEHAAQNWAAFGNPFERAHALAGQGRCLAALGRADESEVRRSAAQNLFTELGVAEPTAPPPSGR
jgi:tetratricopeptide (TPR) repeat protein